MRHRPVMRRSSFVLVLGVLALALTGCSETSFIGSRLDNFTAYYNTFYNARQSFHQGVKALEKQDQPVDRHHYLPLFTSPAQAASGKDFENAIKKSADVLRDHPGSKWVDDALLLIGKSYFYQQNYVGGEQKFREVIRLGGPLEDEARFWLARTLIASGAFEEAREHLLGSLNREGLSPRWAPKLQLALGELYVKRGDWEGASEQLAKGLEQVRDNDLGSRAQFLLGQVLETQQQYAQAAEAYRRVQHFNPLYELSYAAQLSAVRVEGLHGDMEVALKQLRRMERDDKHYSSRYEMAYVRARIYQAHRRPGDALSLYDEILYDAEGNIGNLRGRVHYALGELFRDAYDDYLLAAAHFDTAKTSLGPAPGGRTGAAGRAEQEAYAPEAITDASEQAEVFKSFAAVHEEIARMDSLMYLGSLDEEAFAAAILEVRKQLAQEMADKQRLAEEQEALQRFQGSGAVTQDTRTTTSAAAQSTGSAGFLYHKDPVRVQEGRMNFVQRWGDRPLVPNWRRIDAVSSMGQVAEQQSGAEDAALPVSAAENEEMALPTVDYSAVPRDSVSQARMRASRAMARYELANVLFLSMNRPDSAAAWYRLVIEEDPDQPVAQRAFYALAEVQRSLGDTASARRLYEQVLRDYPDSDFAGKVRERLGLEVQAVSDTLGLAEAAYDEAYARWQRGAYGEALNRMVSVAAQYTATSLAPRALLAAGTIYMEWAARDSLDLFAPLPLQVPDTLLARCTFFEEPADAPGAGAPAATQPTAAPGVQLASTDTLGLAAEPLADGPAVPDTAAADTVGTAAVAATGMLAALETDPVYLQTLYAGVKRGFPTTPYAQQAELLLKVLDEHRASLQPPVDSLAADSAAVDSLVRAIPDSLGTPAAEALATPSPTDATVPPEKQVLAETEAETAAGMEAEKRRLLRQEEQTAAESGAARRPQPEVLPPPEEKQQRSRGEAVPPPSVLGASTQAPSLFGSEAIDPAAGGWTLLLEVDVDRSSIDQLIQSMRYQGFRAGVLTGKLGDLPVYRAVIGQFATEAEARAALETHADRLPDGLEVYQMTPPEH